VVKRLILGGVAALAMAGLVSAPTASADAYLHGDCGADVTPVKDGICKVSDGGFFSTGLMAGWIESAGPRDPAHYPNCMWDGCQVQMQVTSA